LVGYERDVLARNLDVIFCGLNPAESAALAGPNFSNRSNRFWMVLHLADFTESQLQPENEQLLLNYGCGMTAIVRRPTHRAYEVLPEEFRKVRPEFEAKMRYYAPRSIAFLGKRAVSIMIDEPVVARGEYPKGFAGTMAWVLPNPSGRNRNFPLAALVQAYSELRQVLRHRPAAWRGSARSRFAYRQ
jgi:TDG/mug DNA glycosylase family protein